MQIYSNMIHNISYIQYSQVIVQKYKSKLSTPTLFDFFDLRTKRAHLAGGHLLITLCQGYALKHRPVGRGWYKSNWYRWSVLGFGAFFTSPSIPRLCVTLCSTLHIQKDSHETKVHVAPWLHLASGSSWYVYHIFSNTTYSSRSSHVLLYPSCWLIC